MNSNALINRITYKYGTLYFSIRAYRITAGGSDFLFIPSVGYFGNYQPSMTMEGAIRESLSEFIRKAGGIGPFQQYLLRRGWFYHGDDLVCPDQKKLNSRFWELFGQKHVCHFVQVTVER